MPITKIRNILSSKQIPNKYRCRVKVVDYMPRKFENFTRPYCTICKKTFDKVKDHEPVCVRCEASGNKIKYAFLFSLLVEDDGKHFLPIIIFEIGKLWKFGTKHYYIDKEKVIGGSKTTLCGNYFDVCIERYKTKQGIRQKVFDTRLI
ncbi:hypothetical protein BCR32DRAFT_247918 [Anaeromyces robustus]|uniref:Replication factor A C-terminal domain-containing protein n=1 Tax=Anaeromyces robustus TaxID=1754192 RepID=A0A1Y1WV63_9FUNG|nr:hypothetical protein BCR32DRAFT_247918 [Anaeromyces robustus]|eukprot:ORX77449.1 hypothetical protein BCR32DRAFT_247918 [Anaeromyces robustus]